MMTDEEIIAECRRVLPALKWSDPCRAYRDRGLVTSAIVQPYGDVEVWRSSTSDTFWCCVQRSRYDRPEWLTLPKFVEWLREERAMVDKLLAGCPL